MLTISRQIGAGGDQITRLVAEKLGCRMMDNALAEKLLVEKGFPQTAAETFNERKPDLWHRLSAGKERYLHYLKLVSYEFARQGSFLILGRGGQLLFADVPGILKVRVVAPLEDRVRKLSAETGLDTTRALQQLQHSDTERAGFHRFLFHADWDSSFLYDLVINSHQIGPQAAAELILETLASAEVRARKGEALRRLEQLYLVQKAFVSILFEQKLPVRYLEIDVHNGTVTLKGVARDHPCIERCREAAAGVFAKRRINNEIGFEPKYVEVLSGLHHRQSGDGAA